MTLFLGRCDRCQRSIVQPAESTGLVQVETIIKPLEIVVAVDPASGPDSGSTILAGVADDGQFVVLAVQVDESGQAAGETGPPGAEVHGTTCCRCGLFGPTPWRSADGYVCTSCTVRAADRVAVLEAELARADSAATANLEMARGYQAASQRLEAELAQVTRERDDALEAFTMADDLAKSLMAAAERDADVIEVLGGGAVA
jgi:hypothetical protein